jgi:hypothetical protein
MGHDRTTKGPRPATPDPPPAASLLRLDISQALVYDRGASFLTACRRADQLRPKPRTALVAARLPATGLGKRADSNPL